MLDGEARERLTDALRDMGPVTVPVVAPADPPAAPEAEPVENVESPTTRAPPPETPSISDTPKDEGPAEGASRDDSTGHHVPYSRFKTVISERNDYATEIARLRQENETLKARGVQPRTEAPQEHQGSSERNDAPPATEADRFDLYERKLARIELDAEVNQAVAVASDLCADALYRAIARQPSMDARSKAAEWQKARAEFPDVEPHKLRNAFLYDPSADLVQTARAIRNHDSEQYEAFVARQRAEGWTAPAPKQASAPAPASAPPRPRDSGNADVKSGAGDRPKSIADASRAVRELLRAGS